MAVSVSEVLRAQCCSVSMSCLTLQPHGLQHAKLPGTMGEPHSKGDPTPKRGSPKGSPRAVTKSTLCQSWGKRRLV